jgi:hypothetical protein
MHHGKVESAVGWPWRPAYWQKQRGGTIVHHCVGNSHVVDGGRDHQGELPLRVVRPGQATHVESDGDLRPYEVAYQSGAVFDCTDFPCQKFELSVRSERGRPTMVWSTSWKAIASSSLPSSSSLCGSHPSSSRFLLILTQVWRYRHSH